MLLTHVTVFWNNWSSWFNYKRQYILKSCLQKFNYHLTKANTHLFNYHLMSIHFKSNCNSSLIRNYYQTNLCNSSKIKFSSNEMYVHEHYTLTSLHFNASLVLVHYARNISTLYMYLQALYSGQIPKSASHMFRLCWQSKVEPFGQN